MDLGLGTIIISTAMVDFSIRFSSTSNMAFCGQSYEQTTVWVGSMTPQTSPKGPRYKWGVNLSCTGIWPIRSSPAQHNSLLLFSGLALSSSSGLSSSQFLLSSLILFSILGLLYCAEREINGSARYQCRINLLPTGIWPLWGMFGGSCCRPKQ